MRDAGVLRCGRFHAVPGNAIIHVPRRSNRWRHGTERWLPGIERRQKSDCSATPCFTECAGARFRDERHANRIESGARWIMAAACAITQPAVNASRHQSCWIDGLHENGGDPSPSDRAPEPASAPVSTRQHRTRVTLVSASMPTVGRLVPALGNGLRVVVGSLRSHQQVVEMRATLMHPVSCVVVSEAAGRQ